MEEEIQGEEREGGKEGRKEQKLFYFSEKVWVKNEMEQ